MVSEGFNFEGVDLLGCVDRDGRRSLRIANGHRYPARKSDLRGRESGRGEYRVFGRRWVMSASHCSATRY